MLKLHTTAAVMLLASGVVFGACSSGSGLLSKGDLEKKLSSAAGAKVDFAKCVADAFYPKLSDEEKKTLTKESGSEVLKTLAKEADGTKLDCPISKGDLEKTLATAGGLRSAFARCVVDMLYPRLSNTEKNSLQNESGNKALRGVLENKASQAGANCARKGVKP